MNDHEKKPDGAVPDESPPDRDHEEPPDHDEGSDAPQEYVLYEGEMTEEPPPLPPLTISPLDRLRRARAILDCVYEALANDAETHSPHLAERALVVECVRGELGEACHDLTMGHVM